MQKALRDRMLEDVLPRRLLAFALFATLLSATLLSGCRSADSVRQSAVTAPSLGTAASFSVLGGTTVTNTGATTIYGDLGVAPGLAITGFPPGLLLGGATHAGDAIALQGQSDVTAAYIVLAGEACDFNLTGQDLGGLTLTPGVYCFSSAAQLTGKVTLDAQGDASAVFVFQLGSTLTTASGASVDLVNGAQDCRVFWQVGSSATLGTDTTFVGNILALTSIALQTRASLSGRALARNGAVTMDTNHVIAANCSGRDAGVDGSANADAKTDSRVADAASDTQTDSRLVDAVRSDTQTDSRLGDAASDTQTDSRLVDAVRSDAKTDGALPDSHVVDVAGIDVGGGLCCGGVLCGTSCIDVNIDDANCGRCGQACAIDKFCQNGACVTCSIQCGGACANLVYDEANCGSCGNVCLPSAKCKNGSCVPCSSLCGGACTDLVNDQNHCGSCSNVCLPSANCQNGSCVPCSSLCGGACTDLVNDRNNCGSCGNVCVPGESCSGGSCVCQ